MIGLIIDDREGKKVFSTLTSKILAQANLTAEIKTMWVDRGDKLNVRKMKVHIKETLRAQPHIEKILVRMDSEDDDLARLGSEIKEVERQLARIKPTPKYVLVVRMVAQNFAPLNKASSLVVNGHHRVPPRPATWPPSSPSGTGAAGLPTISSRPNASQLPSQEVQNLYEKVAHWPSREHLGLNWPISTGSFAVRLSESEPDSDNRPKPNCQRTDMLTIPRLAKKVKDIKN